MNNTRAIILVLYSIAVSLQTTFAQGGNNSDYYNIAYSEITDMLKGDTPLSVRRAVFLAEWAYLDGNLDYVRDFCEPIKKGADYLKRMIAVNQWEKYKTAKQIVLCNFFFNPCSGNEQNPFRYDFSQDFPDDDWHHQLVSRIIKTHKGQCHSLPWTFKLYDKDKNIYVGSFNKMGEFVRGNSIGITTSMTSFYNSDAQGGGQWSIGSIIDTNDRSGDKFLEKIIASNPPMIDDYMMNARNNKPYDFKMTNGTYSPIKGIDIYRGMPVGENGKGQTIYTSARDVGNIAAGYVAGVNGMSWEASRIAFDSYQGGMEGKSTRYAERYGWTMGYNNARYNKKMDNLLRSVGGAIKSPWNYFVQ